MTPGLTLYQWMARLTSGPEKALHCSEMSRDVSVSAHKVSKSWFS